MKSIKSRLILRYGILVALLVIIITRISLFSTYKALTIIEENSTLLPTPVPLKVPLSVPTER